MTLIRNLLWFSNANLSRNVLAKDPEVTRDDLQSCQSEELWILRQRCLTCTLGFWATMSHTSTSALPLVDQAGMDM